MIALIPEYQRICVNNGAVFPTNISLLKSMATANRSVTDDDPVKGYAYNSEMEIDLYAATQKQIDGVYSMINFARQEQYYYLNDVFFTDIIMTEAEAYFSGIHTVNETLNAISLKLS